MYQEIIKQELVTAQQALADFIADAENINAIEQAAKLIAASLRDGGKVMSCGNGGSAGRCWWAPWPCGKGWICAVMLCSCW